MQKNLKDSFKTVDQSWITLETDTANDFNFILTPRIADMKPTPVHYYLHFENNGYGTVVWIHVVADKMAESSVKSIIDYLKKNFSISEQ